MCLSIYAHEMHLIGWQNAWQQAPGVPAHSLHRPDGGGQPWPCTCVHGPKNYVETSTCRCTTTGMSPSLSKNCFCTSGPEHSLVQQRACPHPCQRRLDLWNTMKMRCTFGTSTVMRIRTKAIVVAHNGHDNLVQELHYHLRENKYRYRSEIKSKTFGL